MFKYEKENYEVIDKDDELFYGLMFGKVYGIFSPFEVDNDVEFPKKDEFGGAVLKFIGGGAAYFKIMSRIPTKKELRLILEICKFLQKTFGEYVVAMIHCEPHVEIRKINVPQAKNIDIHFVSSRKNDGDGTLDELIRKLENNEDFTIDDHILRFMAPFMSREDEDKFQAKYLRFINLFNEKNLELPNVGDLSKSDMYMNRIF